MPRKKSAKKKRSTRKTDPPLGAAAAMTHQVENLRATSKRILNAARVAHDAADAVHERAHLAHEKAHEVEKNLR